MTDPVSPVVGSAEPERLVCPGCGVKVTLIETPGRPSRRLRREIVSIAHPIPGCPAFEKIVDPEGYLAAARAAAAHEVKDV